VLDDGDGGRAKGIELGDKLEGRVCIADIVVRKLLALDLPRRRNAVTTLGRMVKGGGLMRILAISQACGKPAAEAR